MSELSRPRATTAIVALNDSATVFPSSEFSSTKPRSQSEAPVPRDPNDPIYHKPRFDSDKFHSRARNSSIIEMENKLNEWREQYMQVAVEEVSEWLQRVAGNVDLNSFVSSIKRRQSLEVEKHENARRSRAQQLNDESLKPSILFDSLQTGVLLCELSMAIEPKLVIRYKKLAAPGSFLARDNIEHFIKASISWGVPRSQLFEVDDLAMRKNDRGVVNSLLDITRVVYIKFQIEPPTLVKYEFEIAEIEAKQNEIIAEPEPEPAPVVVEPEPEPVPVEVIPEPEPEPEPVVLPDAIVISKPRGPRYLPYHADPNDPLDVAVGNLVNKNSLDLLVKRVAKGQYWIGEEKVNHLRLVRHLVLVRVGGGWEPFVQMSSRKIQEQET